MNFESKCYAIFELCKAITELNKLELSHNDLHPNNVVIDEEGNLKIIDWT